MASWFSLLSVSFGDDILAGEIVVFSGTAGVGLNYFCDHILMITGNERWERVVMISTILCLRSVAFDSGELPFTGTFFHTMS